MRVLLPKWTVVCLVAVLVLLTITSMDPCLKRNASVRTAKLQVYCDPCLCPGRSSVIEVTYLGVGKWLTLASLMGYSADSPCIDNHPAKIVDMGVPNSPKTDYAILETAGYNPICPVTCSELTPTPLRFTAPCCGEGLYWANKFRCNTNKCKVLEVSEDCFIVTTEATKDVGAGVFDMCGNLVGVTRCGWTKCEGGRKYWQTCCVRLQKDWFVNAGLPEPAS